MLSWYISTHLVLKNLSVTIAYSIKINILMELFVKILPSNWLKQKLYIRFYYYWVFYYESMSKTFPYPGCTYTLYESILTTMKQKPSKTVNC